VFVHPSTTVVPTWVGTPSAQDVSLFLYGQVESSLPAVFLAGL